MKYSEYFSYEIIEIVEPTNTPDGIIPGYIIFLLVGFIFAAIILILTKIKKFIKLPLTQTFPL